MNATLLQLADSAFPSGSFAHSFGFEAMQKLGHLKGEEALRSRLEEFIWHTAYSALPFLNEAHEKDAKEADEANEVFLSNHIANRASRAQGQSFLLAAEAAFDLKQIREALRHSHIAPAMGAVTKQIGLTKQEARTLYLFTAVRSALSAAVRLGVVGPLKAQNLLFHLDEPMSEAKERTKNLTAEDAATCAPLLDHAQGTQDRLYSRLFQS